MTQRHRRPANPPTSASCVTISLAELLPIVHRCIRNVQSGTNRPRLSTNRNCIESLYQLCEIAKHAPSSGTADPSAECLVELAGIIETVGCETLEDCLSVCIGPSYLRSLSESLNPLGLAKLKLLLEHTTPIGVRHISYEGTPADGKLLLKNRMTTNTQLVQSAPTLCCFDMARTRKEFGLRVSGMEVVFREKERNRISIVSVMTDELWPESLDSQFLRHRKTAIHNKLELSTSPTSDSYKKCVINALSLKEYLVYSEEELLQAARRSFRGK